MCTHALRQRHTRRGAGLDTAARLALGSKTIVLTSRRQQLCRNTCVRSRDRAGPHRSTHAPQSFCAIRASKPRRPRKSCVSSIGVFEILSTGRPKPRFTGAACEKSFSADLRNESVCACVRDNYIAGPIRIRLSGGYF